jgi:hypothetical protein
VTVVKLFYRYCEQMGYNNNIGTIVKSNVKHRAHYKEPLNFVFTPTNADD